MEEFSNVYMFFRELIFLNHKKKKNDLYATELRHLILL